MRAPAQKTRTAFTMVEILVVLVMIGVLASLVVPRLFNSGDRQAVIESQALGALLTSAAQRDALTNQPLALAFDPERREFSLQVLASDAEGVASGNWTPAPLVPTVTLTTVELREALADGYQLNDPHKATGAGRSATWRIELGQAQQRPTITIVIAHGDSRAWQLDLLPGELASRLREIPATSGPVPPDERSEDLDSTGRRDQAW